MKANSIAFTVPGPSTRAAFARDRVAAATARRDAPADDRRILEASARYRARLANFIRRRVPDRGEAEDILQEVFYELVAAYRLFEPVEEAGAWLFRVAPAPPPTPPQSDPAQPNPPRPLQIPGLRLAASRFSVPALAVR